jgi:hypothetical protein
MPRKPLESQLLLARMNDLPSAHFSHTPIPFNREVPTAADVIYYCLFEDPAPSPNARIG